MATIASEAQPGGSAADAQEHSERRAERLIAIDLLRGAVMIIMALDHVRDFVHRGAMVALPTDLATTTPFLFATRWITHICAPAFALTAGLGAWFWWRAGRSRSELSRFLATRGAWLMLLELLVMQFAYYFSWSPANPVLLLVLWTLGLSMVLLALLVWLPPTLLAVAAVAVILLHPLLDGITAGQFGSAAGLWNIMHQVGAFQIGSATVVTPYPLLPWAAVMALGFSLGPTFEMEAMKRRRALIGLGLAAVAGFVAMRLINLYGDPVPWTSQPSATFTLMSFLNATKYPASPAFLLMTLGLTFLLLAWLDRLSVAGSRALAVVTTFGRVPLFYYILHFYVAHALATVLALVTYGANALRFVFLPYPSFGGPADQFPSGFGYDLWVTYLMWLAVVVICYPVCRWYASLKAGRRSWWLSYL